MCDRLAEPLSLDDLAGRTGLSRYAFLRRFASSFGNDAPRLPERAKELLARDDLPVTDVCCQVGFSSLGSFSVPAGGWTSARGEARSMPPRGSREIADRAVPEHLDGVPCGLSAPSPPHACRLDTRIGGTPNQSAAARSRVRTRISIDR
jgi:AraC-like DNA-binding protein